MKRKRPGASKIIRYKIKYNLYKSVQTTDLWNDIFFCGNLMFSREIKLENRFLAPIIMLREQDVDVGEFVPSLGYIYKQLRFIY